jgi:hypothetical protein
MGDGGGEVWWAAQKHPYHTGYSTPDLGIIGDLAPVVIAMLWEPADWAMTFNAWAHGDFHVLDLVGLLPVASSQFDDAAGLLWGANKLEDASGATRAMDKLEDAEDVLHAADRAGVDEAGTIIYRGGKTNPGNLTPRPQDMGELSFRDSLSNPWPLPAGERPPLPAGKPYFGVDTSQLPPLSVTFDNIPPGHVFVKDVPVEVFKRPGVIVERGKFPK